MRQATFAFSMVLVSIAVGSAHAQQGFIPPKGRSADQQSRDVTDCQGIAVQQSGFNPATAPPPAAPPPHGQRARGAARGAAVGAAAGAIGGDAGKGAAAGAAAGTVAGGVRKRQAGRQAQQQQAAVAQGQASYNKALAACMQGKGYTMK